MNTLSKVVLSCALAMAASFSMSSSASVMDKIVEIMSPQEQYLCTFESGYGEMFNRVVMATGLPNAIEEANKLLNAGERVLACEKRKY